MNLFSFIFFFFQLPDGLLSFIFRSLYEKRIVNPGMLHGPWLPLYGFGGLILLLSRALLFRYGILTAAVYYFTVFSLLELGAGIILEKVFDRRYWDYSENRFNIMGYICPLYSMGWVIIGLAGSRFILPFFTGFVSVLADSGAYSFNRMIMFIMVSDIVISVLFTEARLQKIKENLNRRFRW